MIEKPFNFLIFLAIIVQASCISSQSPAWMTSSYFRGANKNIITSITGNTSTPTFSFTYSSAFDNTPQIAYGIKRYNGNDKLRGEAFRINRLTANKSSFSGQVQIIGFTNVLYLAVAYIAVDPAFPHHLNSFDNVPLNYTGTLDNIDTSTSSTRSHTQVINYQTQAAGKTFKTFSTPLTNNKVLMFLTTIDLHAFNSNQFIFTNSYSILNTTHYSMKVQINAWNCIYRIHYSLIIFDYQDVISSNTYQVVYEVNTALTGASTLSMPAAFQTNFIMGLSSFDAPKWDTRIYYEWEFVASLNQIQIKSSTPPTDNALSKKVSVMFYIKKWKCPITHPFYNITSQLCQDDCAIYYHGNITLESCVACHYSCLQCSGTSSNQCSACDSVTDRRYLENSYCRCQTGYGEPFTASSVCSDCTSQVANCQSCTFDASNNVQCIDCANGFYPSTPSSCIACNTYISGCQLCANDGSCTQCDSASGYYIDENLASPTYRKCVACSVIIPNCNSCINNTYCGTCDTGNQYFFVLNPSDSQRSSCAACSLAGCTLCSSLTQCTTCENSINYFLDTVTTSPTYETCILCSLPGCTSCSSLTQCLICDNTANYFLDTDNTSPTYQTCIPCPLSGCISCSSLTQCSVCDNSANYFLDSDNTSPTYQTCIGCSLTGCSLCSSLTQCNTCDNSNNYFPDTDNTSPTYNQCILCSLNQCTRCSTLTRCNTCNNPANFFLDQDSFSPTYEKCLPCSLNGCITCLSLTQCLTCDNSAQLFLNTDSSSLTYKKCIGCSLTGCTLCDSLTKCNTCDNSANYFLDNLNTSPTYQTCITCSLVGCILCSSLTQCNICDNSAQYFLNTDNTSPTYQKCITCPLIGCTTCSSLTQCSACDNTANYFLDDVNTSPTYKTCILCSLPGCIICSSLTTCASCDNSANYFLDSDISSSSYQTCVLCTIPNCIRCSNLNVCQDCDTLNDYFKVTDVSDPNFSRCSACSLLNCNDCNNATYCASCNTQFYISQYDNTLPQYGSCISCQDWIPSCLNCQNDSFCSQCSVGYYINMDNTAVSYGYCQACTILNCEVCLNGTYCSQCSTNHFTVTDLTDPTYGECQACSITNCITCASLTQCQTCDTSAGYHLDFEATSVTYGYCILCPVANCLTCNNITHCLVCDNTNNFYVDQDVSASTFGQCIACSALPSLSNCIVCQNKTACKTCDTSNHYHLNYGTRYCELCALSNCNVCASLTQCQSCDTSSGFFLNITNKQCEACSLTGCLTCATLTTCSVCDISNEYSLTPAKVCDKCWANCNCNGFVLPRKTNGDCSTVCGDGMKREDQQCDDGNTNNDDGCSSECLIQEHWECPNQAQCCQVSTQLTIAPVFIYKHQMENSINISLHIQPWLPIYCQKSGEIFELPSFITISNFNSGQATSLKAQAVLCNEKEQTINILFKYEKSQHKKEVIMKITPSLPPFSTNCSPAPVSAELSFVLQSDNNLAIIPFSQSQYESAKIAQKFLYVIQAGSYSVMILSTLACKVVGLQLFGVLQLAFFTLADNDDVNLYLSSLLDSKPLNGFNMKISNQSNKGKRTSSARLRKSLIRQSQHNKLLQSQSLLQFEEVPVRVNALGFQSPLFIDNCNIMLGVILVQIVIAFIIYLVTKCLQGSKFKTAHKIAKFLFQEVFLTLILFNCFNIAFSASIHFTYATGDQELYLISTILAIASLFIPAFMIVMLICADSKQFGQFKNKLKKDFVSQAYVPIMIAYRVGLGMYIGAMNEFETSTLIATFISIVMLMYTLINLPFKDAYQNYRAVLCNTTIMIVLFVTMYYRSMKSNIQAQERAIIYAPALIEIILIALCMVVSIIVLLYQIYVFITNCCCSKKEKKKRAKRINKNKVSNFFNNEKKSELRNETEYDFQIDFSGANMSQFEQQIQKRTQQSKQQNIIFQENQNEQRVNERVSKNTKQSFDIEIMDVYHEAND